MLDVLSWHRAGVRRGGGGVGRGAGPDCRRTGLAAIAACLFLAACDGGTAQDERFVTRDSAGVSIVESFAPAWGDERRWSIDPEPVFSIGQEDGDAAYQLHRVTGVVRMQDGRIAVANGGSNEIRLYAPDGRHLGSVGGSGEGPGEFRALMGLYRLPGDSLFAYDLLLDRRSLFGPEGDFVRVVEPAEAAGQRHYIEAVLPDGSIVTASAAETISHLSLPHGFLRQSYNWIRRRQDLVPLDTLGVFLSAESLNVRGENFAAYVRAPFLHGTHSAVRDGDIVLGESEVWELRSLDFDGELLKVIRRHHELRPLSSTDVEQVRNDADPELRPGLMDVDFSGNYPAYTMVRADTDGHIWVREYQGSPDASTEQWTVLSPDGEWLGTVEAPRTVSVAELGPDYMLALVRDDLGLENVRMYRLRR